MEQTDAITNYYEILEVSPQASEHDIHQAYLNVKKAYSLRNPDIFKSFSFDELQQLLIVIEEAYATIGNKDTREIYDAKFFTANPGLKTQLGSVQFVEDEAAEKTENSGTLPEGYAKTTLSIYEIDESFEALIHSQEFYDGIFLGKIRKYKRVKLEDFSQHTCISIKYLYAIEDNNYNALPAAVFTRGYINQYCKLLDLPAEKVISSFMKLYTNGRE
jgi:curved DNA-binding protein CbpA